MPKYSSHVVESEPMYGARIVQPEGSRHYEVTFRDRPVGRFATQGAASEHLWRLIEKVQQVRRRR